jgi:hypothetical protein
LFVAVQTVASVFTKGSLSAGNRSYRAVSWVQSHQEQAMRAVLLPVSLLAAVAIVAGAIITVLNVGRRPARTAPVVVAPARPVDASAKPISIPPEPVKPAEQPAVREPEKKPDDDAPRKVTVDMETVVWQAYKANVAKADKQYLGAIVELKVMRGQIGKTKDGRYFFASRVVSPAPDWVTPGIICYIAKASVPKLEKLEPKQALRVQGKCAGRSSDSTAWEKFRITFEECEILDVLEYSKGSWKPVKQD